VSNAIKSRLGAAAAALTFLFCSGGIGAFAAWAIGATIHDGMRAREWVRVKAKIERVESGTTTYSYEWQGKRYFGDRSGTFVLGGSSEVDDWDYRMEGLVAEAVEQKKPITIWVNPEDPRESMLDREIRWKLLAVFVPFAVGFGAAGITAFVLIGRDALPNRTRPKGVPKGSYAGVPLLKPRARQALFQWAVALVWNSVTLPIALIGIPHLYAEGAWFPIVFLAIFLLVGALIVWGALASTWAVLRDGNPFNARSAT
jgi:hypothetical protein